MAFCININNYIASLVNAKTKETDFSVESFSQPLITNLLLSKIVCKNNIYENFKFANDNSDSVSIISTHNVYREKAHFLISLKSSMNDELFLCTFNFKSALWSFSPLSMVPLSENSMKNIETPINNSSQLIKYQSNLILITNNNIFIIYLKFKTFSLLSSDSPSLFNWVSIIHHHYLIIGTKDKLFAYNLSCNSWLQTNLHFKSNVTKLLWNSASNFSIVPFLENSLLSFIQGDNNNNISSTFLRLDTLIKNDTLTINISEYASHLSLSLPMLEKLNLFQIEKHMLITGIDLKKGSLRLFTTNIRKDSIVTEIQAPQALQKSSFPVGLLYDETLNRLILLSQPNNEKNIFYFLSELYSIDLDIIGLVRHEYYSNSDLMMSLGLDLMSTSSEGDIIILTLDGYRIPTFKNILEARWGENFINLINNSNIKKNNISDQPIEIFIPHTYPVVLSMIKWFYTLMLIIDTPKSYINDIQSKCWPNGTGYYTNYYNNDNNQDENINKQYHLSYLNKHDKKLIINNSQKVNKRPKPFKSMQDHEVHTLCQILIAARQYNIPGLLRSGVTLLHDFLGTDLRSCSLSYDQIILILNYNIGISDRNIFRHALYIASNYHSISF